MQRKTPVSVYGRFWAAGQSGKKHDITRRQDSFSDGFLVFELIGTACLEYCNAFAELLPALGVIVSYALALIIAGIAVLNLHG